jgi:hypothetical protein
VKDLGVKSSRNAYWRRLAIGLAIIVSVSLPTVFGDRPQDAPLLPWSWLAYSFEIGRISGGWPFDRGVWPWIFGIGTVSLCAIAANRKIASVALTAWFVLNELAGYSLMWILSHS